MARANLKSMSVLVPFFKGKQLNDSPSFEGLENCSVVG